ncbi:MAG: hypothetical protein ACRBFS_05055, partial [Aureispira sp.]
MTLRLTMVLALLVLVTQQLAAQWTQLGNDIEGSTSSEYSGRSVSANATGNIIATSSVNFSNTRGRIKVFSYNSTTGAWVQLGNSILGSSADRLGESVSLNAAGNIIAVGGSGRNASSSLIDVGVVQVYMYNGTSWVQLGSDILGSQNVEQLGRAVSLSADGLTLAIGSPTYDNGTRSASGRVRVYRYNGSRWSLSGILESTNAGYELGTSVDISADGSTIVAGGPGSSNPTFNSSKGKMAIFRLNGGSWIEEYSYIAQNRGYRLGVNVTVNADGSRVGITVPGDLRNQQGTGSVRFFEKINNNWTQTSTITNVTRGYGIALDSIGSTVAVGVLGGAARGYINIYKKNGTSWTFQGGNILGNSGDGFGGVLDLNYDGYTVIGGAPSADYSFRSNAGAARVYRSPQPCTASNSSITITACDSYMALSGNYTFTTSGTYMDTISNTCGADSIITINLTINNS